MTAIIPEISRSPDATFSAAVEKLAPSLRGEIIQADHPSYDSARRVYNGMIDRRPALIVRCADIADVMAVVRFAGDQGMDLSIRGGGHSVVGFSTNDDGIVLDLSRLRGIQVDPKRRVARVEGGATWGDVDHATHGFGLATPGGIISTTGVAGLTLGGGFGHLTRRFGLCIDNLLSANIVLADGTLVTANEQENSDLFWAIRGGGGNFGVVTSLEFRLYPISIVYGGPIFFLKNSTADVLAFFRDFIAAAPPQLSAFFAFHMLPPAPFVPEKHQGQVACAIVPCYTGPLNLAEAAITPIRNAAPIVLDMAGPMPYPALNSLFDSLIKPGLNHYWKADFDNELSDEAMEIHEQYGLKLPSFTSLVHIYPLDGAVQNVASDATAFPYRDVGFTHMIAAIDSVRANMPTYTAWVRAYWNALRPMSAGGAYVNFLMDEGQDRIKATYRDNYPRLSSLKKQFDPENVFHMNQNIQ